jgi:methylase of polypeptide subunit release factors
MNMDAVLESLFDEPEVNRAISPRDTMYTGDDAYYWGTGISALRNVRLALLMSGRSDTRRLLDLPCGHGRVLRYLCAAFPEAEIVACDLDRDGVDYCAQTFGALPVYSDPDPARIKLPGTST